MTETINIPLSKLVAWDGNVRKTDPDAGIDELAASIASHGLLQSLVVRKAKGGKFAVVAGRRRLFALQALADAEEIDPDAPVPCHVVDRKADAAEISLAENVVRVAMHPADQFEAFRDLAGRGHSPADIAARFGVSETTVLKRLKLARVSPVILAAYRAAEIGLEQVMAFAITDDHAAQERLWTDSPPWVKTSPRSVRNALTEDDIPATDKRVKFVTLTAYEQEGGAVRRDLFSDDEDGVFILDAALLDRLAVAKLEEAAESVRAQGWKWVETYPEFDHDARSRFSRVWPEQQPLSDEDEAELSRLAEEYDALVEQMDDGEDEEASARLDVIDRRMAELQERERVFPPEAFTIAGAILTISYDGEVDVIEGLVRPEDEPPQQEDETEPPGRPGNGHDEEEQSPSLPAVLIEDLTAQRSAALSAELIVRPDVALAAVVHALTIEAFGGYGFGTSLQITAAPQSFGRAKGSRAFDLIERERESWGGRLPGDADGLWQWCLEQDRNTLLGLLAFCAAATVDAVQRKGDRPGYGRFRHADALAAVLGLDMAGWFTPTAENFFSRITRPGILAAIEEAKNRPGAPAWSKMKKTELAALAEEQVAGTGWLPAPLRGTEPDTAMQTAT